MCFLYICTKTDCATHVQSYRALKRNSLKGVSHMESVYKEFSDCLRPRSVLCRIPTDPFVRHLGVPQVLRTVIET